MKKATTGWLESAKMDLDSLELIKDQSHLTPVIAFHSHQAVEKVLKAVLEEKQQNVAKTHDLIFLFKKTAKLIFPDLDRDVLKRLNELYIDARYPGELGLLLEGKPALKDANQFYEFAKNIYNQVIRVLEEENEKDEGQSKK